MHTSRTYRPEPADARWYIGGEGGEAVPAGRGSRPATTELMLVREQRNESVSVRHFNLRQGRGVHHIVFADDAVELRNPLSEDHSRLRPSLLAELLMVLERNIRAGRARTAHLSHPGTSFHHRVVQ